MLLSRSSLVLSMMLAAPMAVNAATSASFSYEPDAEYGPANWGMLPIEGNACDGESNSPVAVETGPCDRYEDYTMTNGSCRTNDLIYSLTNTGVKASYPSEDICEHPRVEIPGIPGVYEALQFHIHTSSEHTVDGKHFGAELHTVHAEIGGDRYAVVGMMIHPDADEDNEMIAALIEGWQTKFDASEDACAESEALSDTAAPDTTATTAPDSGARKLLKEQRELQPQVFSPYQLVPTGATFYHYDGGLTTPPCSEVVWWNLADKAVSITPGQYLKLTEFILDYTDPSTCEHGTSSGSAGSTSRPIQPLNGRTVERICPVDFKDTTC